MWFPGICQHPITITFSSGLYTEGEMEYIRVTFVGFVYWHNNDDTWALRHLKAPAIELFVQQVVWLTTKKWSKLHITGPLWGESIGNWWTLYAKAIAVIYHHFFFQSRILCHECRAQVITGHEDNMCQQEIFKECVCKTAKKNTNKYWFNSKEYPPPTPIPITWLCCEE